MEDTLDVLRFLVQCIDNKDITTLTEMKLALERVISTLESPEIFKPSEN
jgi:hypothetical protein